MPPHLANAEGVERRPPFHFLVTKCAKSCIETGNGGVMGAYVHGRKGREQQVTDIVYVC